MSNVQIFKNHDEYLKREDSSVNGVSQEFLEANQITLESLILVNCISCWNCIG